MIPMRTCTKFSLAFALSATILTGWSDDAVIFATGGTARLMTPHPSIRMVREEVYVKLYPDRAEVDCTFVFKNEGKATTVQIGFPETKQGGTDMKPQESPMLDNFRAYLDGRPTTYRILKAQKDDYDFAYWYVRKVRFEAGQQRTTRVTFSAMLGANSIGEDLFEYVLHTGASWQGTIGSGRIVIDTTHLLPDYTVVDILRDNRFRRQGYLLIWEFNNLEPTREDDLLISIAPRNSVILYAPGYQKNENGREPYLPRFHAGEPTAIVRNGVLYVQWSALAEALGGQQAIPWKWDRAAKQLRVVAGERTVVACPNQLQVSVNQRAHRLKTPLLYARDSDWELVLWVPLREFLELLGYEVQVERSVSDRFPVVLYKVYVRPSAD